MSAKYSKYIDLLRQMIAIPSFSREEDKVADLICRFLEAEGCKIIRTGNNIIVDNRHETNTISNRKPLLMLNSHIDTVKPVDSWTRNPFDPEIADGALFGLGSNDAGASVVSLMATLLELRNIELPVDLLLAISCQEECSGAGGISSVLPQLPRPDMAIVGEPTGMQAAVGERGLVVLDCVSRGKSGHAARNEGVNALEMAVDDICRLRNLSLPASELLGETKLTVTQIEAGYRHNVVPDECRWVVDIRTTDAISNEEVVETIRRELTSEVTPRSTRLRASAIPTDHPLVKAAMTVGAKPFNSPTMSDMALIPVPSLKIGPGDSARSHSADEYILLSEIEDAIDKYICIIKAL